MKRGLPSALFHPRSLAALFLSLAGGFLAVVGFGARGESSSYGGTDINLITGTETTQGYPKHELGLGSWKHGCRCLWRLERNDAEPAKRLRRFYLD